MNNIEMIKSAIIIAFFSFSLSANADKFMEGAICSEIGEIAKWAAASRDKGTPMRVLWKEAETRSNNEAIVWLSKVVINDAYDNPDHEPDYAEIKAKFKCWEAFDNPVTKKKLLECSSP